ncbi:MAG: hypothetical protein PUE12_07670 [Oscillospiraceae bacterium]|nr:hypothetical protein [Oscillospiraceae bacterium]
MKKYLTAYLEYIDKLLSGNTPLSEEIKKEHLRQIQFMQHERLVHLIVTVLFALIMIICTSVLVITESPVFLLLTLLILVLLIPYIMHYYFLENSVQKMYRQYNAMTDSKLPELCTDMRN